MIYGVLDTESTIFEKGHPFSERNRLCLVGLWVANVSHIFNIEYDERPYKDELDSLQHLLNSLDLLVLFNAKVDLHWLKRYGISIPDHCNIFDCQLAEYLLTNQREVFPSLDRCAIKYNLGRKLDVVEREYWSLGIDTPDVPLELLVKYLEQDLELTHGTYQAQQRLVEQRSQAHQRLVERRGLEPLVRLHMADLKVLAEMEYNGIRLDWVKMEQAATETQKELNEINGEITNFAPPLSHGIFNTRSNDHVSLLLYGGRLEMSVPRPYSHTYKQGLKKGITESRNKWEPLQVQFPRLVDPREGTELKKPGYWSTGADILKELPRPKKLLSLLLKQSDLSKLISTYYHGWKKTAEKMDWQDGYVHSQLNQCVAVTGRLASSRPNQQNMDPRMHEFITTRY